MDEIQSEKLRFRLIDGIRGICVLGMVIYHTLFDIVAFFGNASDSSLLTALDFIRDFGAAVFILVSGFCFSFCSHRLRRFLILFFAGVIVTAATYIVMPESYVIFGILTFMAFSGGIMIFADKLLKYVPPLFGCILCVVSFFVLFRMNYAYIGTYGTVFCYLPFSLYKNYFTAFFGFPFNGFISGDYYPLFPWMFIYTAGYFLKKITDKSVKAKKLMLVKIPFFDKVGKYSLYIYLAHQPVVYCIVWLAYVIINK